MEQSRKQCFISVQQQQQQLQQQQQQESFKFILFMIIHDITRTFTHIQKKLLVEGDTHIEAVRKGKNILQTVRAIVI